MYAEAPAARAQAERRIAETGAALDAEEEEIRVVEAGSAEEARAPVDRGLPPDLLVTDHLMPGVSCTELARMLRGTLPGIKVLIVSGYAETDGIEPDLPRLIGPLRNADLAESLAALV